MSRRKGKRSRGTKAKRGRRAAAPKVTLAPAKTGVSDGDVAANESSSLLKSTVVEGAGKHVEAPEFLELAPIAPTLPSTRATSTVYPTWRIPN